MNWDIAEGNWKQPYARMESKGGWATTITPELAAFVAGQTSVFLGTANADGQPYIQHRGGPPGFLRVLDDKTIAFADFRGNRQFITAGNLAENPKAHLFLIDYGIRRRIKLWGTARIDDDPALVARLMPAGYKAKGEQALLFNVDTWDANCPQHIPQRFDAADVAIELEKRERRIAELEEEVERLKTALRHYARTGDDDAVKQALLAVAAALPTGDADSQAAAPG